MNDRDWDPFVLLADAGCECKEPEVFYHADGPRCMVCKTQGRWPDEGIVVGYGRKFQPVQRTTMERRVNRSPGDSEPAYRGGVVVVIVVAICLSIASCWSEEDVRDHSHPRPEQRQ